MTSFLIVIGVIGYCLLATIIWAAPIYFAIKRSSILSIIAALIYMVVGWPYLIEALKQIA